MPEMILDSLFLVANAYIDKHGKLPVRICIRRKRMERLYHITKVVEIACKVTGMKPPTSTNNFNHVKGVLHKAMCEMRRIRRRSKYFPLTRKEPGEVDYRENIVDLRRDYCNVTGMGRQRLVSAAAGKPNAGTQQEAEAAVALVRAAELVIVDSVREAHCIQFYLADRALTAMVIVGEAADPLGLPKTVGQWSKPTVDHQ